MKTNKEKEIVPDLKPDSPPQVYIESTNTPKNKYKHTLFHGPKLAEPTTKKWIKAKYIFVLVFIAVIVFLIGLSALLASNYNNRTIPSPVQIRNEDISHAHFNFLYHYLLLESGIDIYTTPDAKDILSAPGQDPFPTMRDYYLDMTAKDIQTTMILYNDALSNGYSITPEFYEKAQNYLDWLKKRGQNIGTDIKTYIKGYFGETVTQDLILEILAKRYFADYYGNGPKILQLKASDNQAENAYSEAPHLYNVVGYKMIRIVLEKADPNYIASAEAKATKIIELIQKDPFRFESAISEVIEGANQDQFETPDSTLLTEVRYNQVENAEWRTWLFSPDRNPGDTVIFHDDAGFPIVLCFASKDRQNEPLRNIYRLVCLLEDTTANTETVPSEASSPVTAALNTEQKKALMTEILEQIKEASSFLEIEKKYSQYFKDGTLQLRHYLDLYSGQLNIQSAAWIFDISRRENDKVLLENETNLEIIFYNGASENPEWFDRVNSFIASNNYQAFLLEQSLLYSYKFNAEALKLIKDFPGKT